MNLIGTVALSGAMLGAVLAIALRAVRGRNRLANDILALFVLVFSVHLLLLGLLLNHSDFHLNVYPIFLGDVFLFGPLLYLYVRAMTESGFRLSGVDGLHLIPLGLLLLVGLTYSGAQDDTFGSLHSAAVRGWPPSPGALLGFGFYISFSIYMVFSLRRLRAHARSVTEQFSWLEGVNLHWLRILVRASLALALIGLILSVTRLFIDLAIWPRGAYSMLMMIALFYLIAFMAIRQPAIFHAEAVVLEQPDTVLVAQALQLVIASIDESSTPKYETSALNAEQVQLCWQRLLKLMNEQKPYLNNELRLAQLATLMATPAHHLSQVINQSAGQHFLEFITGYRINEARRLLASADYRDKKMIALAFDAGFNSQSAFYKQFRKHLGMTPQQYRAGILQAGFDLPIDSH